MTDYERDLQKLIARLKALQTLNDILGSADSIGQIVQAADELERLAAIPKEKTWGKEGVEIARAVLADAARLTELEACEADAKRWRKCVDFLERFPIHARAEGGNWAIPGFGWASTPEAAVDAAMAAEERA